MIRAVIFDFDGLILDTEGPLFAAWQEAFAAHGCTLTVEDWSAEIGTIGGLDTVGLLQARAVTPVDVEAMHERRRARCSELMAREVPLPGVEAWIDDADALGLALAIASSSPPEWVHPQLERLGLRERFAHVACGSDGRAPKPAPDTYLAACAALAVEPHEALALEDSPHGVAAAKSAGMRCVAVPHAITAGMDLSGADLRLGSLADATLAGVIRELARLN